MKKFLKKVKNGLIYIVIRTVVVFLSYMPEAFVRVFFSFIGRAAYYLAVKERKIAIKNLSMVFSGKSKKEIRRMAKKVFRDLALNFSEVLYIKRIGSGNLSGKFVVKGIEYAREAYEKNRGVIFLSGHVGCFEMLSVFLSASGFPMTVVGTKLYDRRLDRLLVRNRQSHKVRYVERGGNTMDVMRRLKKGECFGVLFDLDTRVPGVYADFFGRPAFTPAGTLRMAMRKNIPVIPVVIQRREDFRHNVTFLPEVIPDKTGNEIEDLVGFVNKCNSALESLIMQAPEQWIWMHDRWRSVPGENRREKDMAYRK